MTYVYCPDGHFAHYTHGGAFEKKWFRAVCDVCGWQSEKVGSQQELDMLLDPKANMESRMNYDLLESGRELDALVAEKIFDEPQSGCFTDSEGFERVYEADPPPFYSTDIADAWLVVEKLTDKWCVRLRSVADESTNKWVCILDPLHSTRHTAQEARAYAETAPLAICRAALKAVATKE